MTPEERTAYIEERKQPVLGQDNQQVQHPVWARERQKYFHVWDVPIEGLVLNVNNKRFSAEREWVERQLGRPLDPTNIPEDEDSVIAILCDSNIEVDLDKGKAEGTPSKDFKALKEDWGLRKQIEPIWIRPDGTVRNGNRRLAMLKRLRKEGVDVNWIKAIVLYPADADEKELFRMEQREQLAENFKKRYQDVNALLALREAAEDEGIDWDNPESIAEVAGILKHYAGRDDAGYASKQLYAIRALDRYLAFINAPGQYSLAMRQVEVFREVGLCMSTYQDEPDEQYELLQAAFAFVQAGAKAGTKHGAIRKLRELFGSDRTLFDQMVREILRVEEESGWDPDSAENQIEFPELSDATAPDDDDDDDDDDDQELAAGPSAYPKVGVGAVIDTTFDRFAASGTEVQKQLDKARTWLEAVNLADLESLQGTDRSDARSVVEMISEWAREAKGRLE